jgi:hypothetical protein
LGKINFPYILKTLPIILALYLTVPTMFNCSAQKDSSSGPGLKFSFYVDAYYAHYTDSVGHGKYQKFGYVSPISDNFGINIAQLSAQYTSNLVRSTITLQYGDIPNVVWSPKFNYIQEAYAGIKICKKLWMDAGFFRTHIGTESMLPKDNICSSQAITSWTEPFYQSGVRFTYTPCDKVTSALYIVNGANQFVATNKKKAAGLALTYNFSDNFNIGYYNLLSDDTPDSLTMSHWRLWNNLVINWNVSKKIKLQAGVDYVTQENSDVQNAPTYTSYSTAWGYGTILTVKYQCCQKFGIYARYETLYDPVGVMVGPDNYLSNDPSYELIGGTLGVEYKPTEDSYIRLEGRELEMAPDEKIFYTNGSFVNNRGEIMINTGISF